MASAKIFVMISCVFVIFLQVIPHHKTCNYEKCLIDDASCTVHLCFDVPQLTRFMQTVLYYFFWRDLTKVNSVLYTGV
jgi:hypothetical protein